MANVKIRHLSKDATWHTANATWVVDLGRIVILTGANPLLFKIGDGVTQLQNLEWSNGTKTLAEILAKDNKVNGLAISSNNGKSLSNLFDTFASFGWFGTKEGSLLANDDSTIIYHDDLIQFDAPSVTKNGYEIATENFVDQRIQSNIKIIGDWDATSGSFPLADESNTTPFIAQWGATIKQGWAFRVGYGQPGTVDGYDYENGDVVYALVDNPTDDSADWGDLDHNLQQASESLRGTAKIVTIAIMEDETTLNDERIVTPYKFWTKAIPKFLSLSNSFGALQSFFNITSTGTISANNVSVTGVQTMHALTGSKRLELNASKEVISVNKGTADNKDFGTTAGTVCEGNDARLTDIRIPKCPLASTTVVSITNINTEQYLTGFLIDGSQLSVNSILKIHGLFSCTNNANNKNIRYYINDTNDLSGTPVQIGRGSYTNSQNSFLMRELWFKGAFNSWGYHQIVNQAASTENTFNSNLLNTGTKDFANGLYLVISAEHTSLTDTTSLQYIFIENYRSS